MKLNEIIQGDALEVLKTFPSESVDCCITSPPYWGLRDYGEDGQLGLEPHFNEYISKLIAIFDEVKRVLKPEGTCWVNLGDTYSGNKEGKTDAKVSDYLKDTTTRLHKKAVIQEKSLCQIPSRFAIAMTDKGWILRNEIIWHKPNCMPSSVEDRFTVDFEKVFFFVKNKKYWFEQQKVERITTEPRADSVVRNRVLKYNSKANKMKQDNVPSKNASTYAGFNDRWAKSPTDGRNKRTVWSISTMPYAESHFATFPELLIETPIKAGCPENGIVLDCFSGAGTTALVSKKLNRQYLGIELNPEYIKIAENRLRACNPLL